MKASSGLLLVLALALVLAVSMQVAERPAQAAEVTIGRFPDLGTIESVLRRGVSREAVRDALGEPGGSGEGRIPPSHAPQQVWYYEDIEVEDAYSHQDYMRLDMRQRILLVFFEGDRVEGYLWTSNVGSAEAKGR